LGQAFVIVIIINNPHQDHFTLERLILGSNLKEFSQQVQYICCLLDYEEMTGEEAENEIEKLYQQLKGSAEHLRIGF
jgi:hypothetical protein